mmetsp:Transcript_15223/g.44812  ORF Transcript_15223/g.44812 Transcript_15223/m.44812 type:complete len:200 (-) Transcript_15223:106-705(-)
MQDAHLVQRRQSRADLDEELPREVVGHGRARREVLLDDARQVAVGRIVHDDADAVAIEEGLVVRHHVGVLHRRQQPDLVRRVLALSLRHGAHVHLLERVRFPVRQPLHLVHGAVAALADDLDHLELHVDLALALLRRARRHAVRCAVHGRRLSGSASTAAWLRRANRKATLKARRSACALRPRVDAELPRRRCNAARWR